MLSSQGCGKRVGRKHQTTNLMPSTAQRKRNRILTKFHCRRSPFAPLKKKVPSRNLLIKWSKGAQSQLKPKRQIALAAKKKKKNKTKNYQETRCRWRRTRRSLQLPQFKECLRKGCPLLSYHFLKAIQGCARHSHLMSLTFKIKLQRNGAGI